MRGQQEGFGGGSAIQTSRITTTARPPAPRRFAARPTGPREFMARLNPTVLGGPGQPPPGFVTATTSGSEWVLYYAFAKVFDDPKDPREGPYFGSRDPALWRYQYAYDFGRKIPGGSVVDYVVFPYATPILVRLQTERYHLFVSPQKQAYDRNQAQQIGKYGTVADIFEADILGDPTGQAAILSVKNVLRGVTEINPLISGQAVRSPAWQG